MSDGMKLDEPTPCEVCGGTGGNADGPCSACGGSGIVGVEVVAPAVAIDEKAVEAALCVLLGYRPRLLNELSFDDLCAGLGRMRVSEVKDSLTRAIEAYLSAAHAPQGGVRVKPLEWVTEPGRGEEFPGWVAETAFGKEYRVFKAWWGKENKWGFVGDEGFAHTADQAKAAAQADYEARILSALTGSDPK